MLRRFDAYISTLLTLCLVTSVSTLPIPWQTSGDLVPAESIVDHASQVIEIVSEGLSELENFVVDEEHALTQVLEATYSECSGPRCYLQAVLDRLPGRWHSPADHHTVVSANDNTDTTGDTVFNDANDANIVDTSRLSVEELQNRLKEQDRSPSPSECQRIGSLIQAGHDLDIPQSLIKSCPTVNANIVSEQSELTSATPSSIPNQTWRPTRYSTIAITAIATMTIMFLFLMICKLLRKHCASPRRRADRAAKREERRRRKMYRSAACRYKFEQWFNSTFSVFQFSSTPEEIACSEKEKYFSGETLTSNHIVESSITSMRNTTQLVDTMISSPISHKSSPSMAQYTRRDETNARDDRDTRSQASRYTVSTLPAYSLPPEYTPTTPTSVSRGRPRRAVSSSTVGFSEGVSEASFAVYDEATESSMVDLESRLSEDSDSVSL